MDPKSFSIGIDIGGTNTAYGIVDKEGKVLEQNRFFTRVYPTPEQFVAALREKLEAMIGRYGKDAVQGIGIGCPNANIYTGEILLAPNLPWKGTIKLRDMMQEAMGLPVTTTNDANATAIGEMIYGAAKGMDDFLLVTLGTGVGSGFVANGKLIYGHDGFAGEMGHVIAVRDGRPCGCGRRGCLETYASATGIVTTAHEWLQGKAATSPMPDNQDWLLAAYQHKGSVSAREIHKAALAGDPLAIEIFDFTGKILGQTLADMVAITRPEVIIFFGGLAKAGEYILKPTRHYMEENLLAFFKNKVPILPSALSERDAAILGAAALVWQ